MCAELSGKKRYFSQNRTLPCLTRHSALKATRKNTDIKIMVCHAGSYVGLLRRTGRVFVQFHSTAADETKLATKLCPDAKTALKLSGIKSGDTVAVGYMRNALDEAGGVQAEPETRLLYRPRPDQQPFFRLFSAGGRRAVQKNPPETTLLIFAPRPNDMYP